MTKLPVAEGVEETEGSASAGTPAARRRSSTHAGRDARRTHRLQPLAVLGMAFAIYLLVSIGLWWQVWSTRPTGAATCGCDDPAFVAWFLAWPAYALSHGHNLFYSTLLFHPTGVNMLANVSALLDGFSLPSEQTILPERPLRVALLTNRTPARERARLHAGLADGLRLSLRLLETSGNTSREKIQKRPVASCG